MASHQEKYDILGGKSNMVYMRITKNCMTTTKHCWVESHQTVSGGGDTEGHLGPPGLGDGVSTH